ncbi:uncharacterized protein TrAtP1_009106 [Trichoderma atroviride]|uniref:uncharacterized protein n=1 Tax=Hypocrea atroviridis TaxID=63577 RepID=UPI00331AAFE6|nr:hypothetical protein TrAtP1_009106 [Trichoderma atroviride]
MDLMKSAGRYTRTACFPCRHSKRRCDKSLPACQLCIRKGVECSYPTRRAQKYVVLPQSSETVQTTAPTRDNSTTSGVARSSESASLERQGSLEASHATDIVQSFATATAIQFIAPRIFRDAHLEIPRINIAIPKDVAAHVGDLGQLHDIYATFSSQAVIWTPVIFRKRFFNIALNPLSPRRTEGVLMCLCMKLYCTPAPSYEDDGKRTLYKIVKEFYAEVEATGIMSVCILQSALLIAVYEIGNAIYPAAYMTVGNCARYGVALGLDKLMVSLTGEGNLGKPWMEIEEMRRVWWGILILDRFLNLGNPSRCLTTKDPAYDDYLPVDDWIFLDVTARPQDNIKISAAFTLRMGPFARLAQATYLVNQALNLVSPLPTQDQQVDSFDVGKESAQLRRTIEALVYLTKTEFDFRDLVTCCQAAISYCAILLLQEHHWQRVRISSTEEACFHLFAESRHTLEILTKMATSMRKDAQEGRTLDEEFPVFLTQVIYQAALATIEMGQGNPDEQLRERLETFKWLLEHMRPKWRVAGIYLSILQSKEVMLAAAL